MKKYASSCPRSANQGGVALIVALVVLVVIGLASAAVMRGALSSDLVANNARVQTLANQAAQVALRYCEAQLVAGTIAPRPAATPLEWETFTNWTDSAMKHDVPEEYLKSELSTYWPSQMPQCMAQYSTAGTATTIVVTARGFSPDFAADTNGSTLSGSVAWLQYILATQ